MRASELPARPSRSVFTIGTAPPTAASKLSAMWFFSAKAASATPWRASNALLAVTTDFLAASAAAIAALAGSPSPPISSTNTSIPSSVARPTGSATQRSFLRSTSRFLARDRADTATTSIGRPQRAASASRWRAISPTTDAPTVPKPAMPTLSGGAIARRAANMKAAPLALAHVRFGKPGHALAPLGQGDDVVQLFGTGFKKAADVARGLPDALLVLYQRDPYVSFAIFAEPAAG